MKGSAFVTIAGVAMLSGWVSCGTLERTPAHVPEDLFNGKNLDGWTHVLEDPTVPRDKVWSVREGLLICQGSPLGVLQTEASFENFRLEVEYRWAPGTPPGNSGILTRINGPKRALPRCAEVQLMNGNAGDVLGLQGMKVAAGQPRFFEIKNHKVAGDISGVTKSVGAERAAGEWNRVEVLASGGTYTVWINDQKVNEATGVEIASGPIGLQSEGGEIHFRRVSVTRLPE